MRTIIHRPSDQASQGGQALVEFALVAPIFFLLLFGVIQLGLIFGGQNGVVAAARDTARYASTYRIATVADATDVCPLVLTQLTNDLGQFVPGFAPSREGTPVVSYTWLQNPDGPNGSPGSYYAQINVGVSYEFPLYVPIVSNIVDGWDGVIDQSARLSAHEEMRIENSALAAGASEVDC